MFNFFVGDDRARAKKEIEKYLGKNYEIFDAENLSPSDLPSLFYGTSLFSESRKILIRDFAQDQSLLAELPKYLNSPHKIIFFELKLNKLTIAYKAVEKNINLKKFDLPKVSTYTLVANIFQTSKTDSKKAIAMLEEIEAKEPPELICGIFNSEAIKDFSRHQGTKQKQILKELSDLDIKMKSSRANSWLLIKSFLVQLENSL